MALKMYSDIDIQDIADAIREKNKTDETYRVDEMPAAIRKLNNVKLELTGDCSKKFYENRGDLLMEIAGEGITTYEITDCESMFARCENLTSIPFVINISSDCDEFDFGAMFNNCYDLVEAPLINGTAKNVGLGSLFNGCNNLAHLPQNYFDFAMIGPSLERSNAMYSLFYNCYSLRKVPDLTNLTVKNSISRAMYGLYYTRTFGRCFTLDELIDLPSLGYDVIGSSAFEYCSRLKRLTFKKNEDGTPLVFLGNGGPFGEYDSDYMNSNTLDLSNYVGYADADSDRRWILTYNSGITADKEVTDAASYEALKNDPDWFTCDINYSRYNKTSAIETINSLWDCNGIPQFPHTVKFKGEAGALTDGGAINTMTEEEIAVATAKGWTVSFV